MTNKRDIPSEILPILVRQANIHDHIYYSDLSAELNWGTALALGPKLDEVGMSLLNLKGFSPIPPIQGLVVNKRTDMPGDAFCRSKISTTWTHMEKGTKQEAVNALHQDIYAFDKWDRVLAALNLQPLTNQPPAIQGRDGDYTGRRGGGESEAHRNLKEFVLNTPKVAGVKFRPTCSKDEVELPSGDRLDVYFRSKTKCAGIEVKSIKSSETDIHRGMFQCVKYREVLTEYERLYGKKREVYVALVLEGKMPPQHFWLKRALNIPVFENVKPT